MLFRDRKMEQLLELVHAVADTQAASASPVNQAPVSRFWPILSTRPPPASKNLLLRLAAGSSETLLESELFGHIRGAFTGAIRNKKANSGGPPGRRIFRSHQSPYLNLQVKLLRALQEKVIERIGGNIPIRTDVTIIIATNSPLKEEVAKNQFREDLYGRINVVALNIPPLPGSAWAMVALAEHFISEFNQIHKRKIRKGFAKKHARRPCLRHGWPGNVGSSKCESSRP